MLLSLPQAGLQQGLDLLLTRPQAVRVTANNLRQEVGEVLGGQGGVVALQVETLNSCHHAARRHHGGRTGNEVNICSTESHEGLRVFPEDLFGGWADLQLGQEVIDEVVRRD